ncbi:hypothetical protein HK100_010209 [Physocladia obscura]|uniref:USP domain-containing protein n=1 Tax=Physocladia obscura TaxID=109957 RepID=A0AAD5T3E7_9FUNG|nr:hypothetical protein HK100_010209 [Physocladia obscura]
MTILEPPKTLVLQFKRFEFGNFQQYGGGKINKMMSFPEKLDLQPFIFKSKSKAIYNLYGVLVHAGHSCNSGHYYSYVKAPNGIWYLKNDSEVKQVSTSKVLEQNAYMLFYTAQPPISSKPLPETASRNADFCNTSVEKASIPQSSALLAQPAKIHVIPFNQSIVRNPSLIHSTDHWKVSATKESSEIAPDDAKKESVKSKSNGFIPVTAARKPENGNVKLFVDQPKKFDQNGYKDPVITMDSKPLKTEFSAQAATAAITSWDIDGADDLLDKRDALMQQEISSNKLKRPSLHDIEYDQGKTKKKKNLAEGFNKINSDRFGGGEFRGGFSSRGKFDKEHYRANGGRGGFGGGSGWRGRGGDVDMGGECAQSKMTLDHVAQAAASAAKVIDSKLTTDRKPDLVELLQKNGEYLTSGEPLLELVERERTIPLPDVLYEQYDFLQCRCFLGLFPEVHRAWITIDHQLFLWNYDSPDDYAVFDDQDQVIVSVGLVKPPPGVFLDEINYLLVVATPIEIILVAVAHQETNGVSSLNLYRTDITIASDNVSMTSIVGSSNGRIFMCGSNGRLYELQYQADDGWFQRKCRKIDLSVGFSIFIPAAIFSSSDGDPIRKIIIDQARNIFYSLSESSHIELYYLGINGTEFKKLFKQAEIFTEAQKWLEASNVYPHPYLDPRNFQIISIHIIPASESNIVNLLAISSSGYRLYFTCYKTSYNQENGDKRNNKEPNCFQLFFVRPPPQNQRDRFRIHESCYSNGTLFAANAINDESDHITCFSSERVSSKELFGQSASSAEDYMIDASYIKRSIVLTNAEYANSNIISWAQRLYFEIGGKPSLKHDNGQQRIIGLYNISKLIKFLLFSDNGPLGRPLTMNEYILSGRHEGLSLYLSRLLAPLWKLPLVKKLSSPKGTLDWKCSQIVLGTILESLSVVNKLLDDTLMLTSAPNPNEIDYSTIGTSQNFGEKEAWQEEKLSMRNLHALIKKTIEGISFVILLRDYKFLTLSDSLEERLVKYLVEESFESLVTLNIGREIGKEIFTKIIQVSEICELAQAKCPTFCCVEDVVLYKGMECLNKAKIEDGQIGRALLSESLNLFLNILQTLTFEKISDLVDSYNSAFAYQDAITLTLSFAQSEDLNSGGLSYFVDGQPPNDYRETLFAKRQKCYQLVKTLIMSVKLPDSEDAVDTRAVDQYRAELVNFGLGFADKLFHFFVFDWFMTDSLNDRLLELNSDYLEDFLAMEPIAYERIELLWKFYVRKEAFVKAAHVLCAMAVSKQYQIPFIQRLELLQLAVANAKSASVTVLDHDFFRDLEDKRDVALIQMEIVTAVSKLGLNSGLSADDMLFDSLLSISDLFTHYARPLNFHEICLLIFHTAEYKDPHLVSQTWVKLIKEVVDSTTIPESEKLVVLEEKVKSLGIRYGADENIFPLETTFYQIPSLRTSAGGDGPSGSVIWVIRVMRTIGISFNKLFEIYYEMFEAKSSPWNTNPGTQFIIARLCHLITQWCKSVETSLAERTRFPAKNVDDALSKLLLDSAGGEGVGRNGGQVKELKDLQDKVRRSFL